MNTKQIFYCFILWHDGLSSRNTTTEFQYSEMHAEHTFINLEIKGHKEKIYETYIIFKESKFRKS